MNHYCKSLCLQALALTPEDGWSVHAVAHVHEMKAEVDKGLKFMASTEKDWMVSLRNTAKNIERLTCRRPCRSTLCSK